ncbi:MAG: DHH family phosphoesterase [Candidatus Dojkabacteria bacterium]|nr:DHH family phosphoesterase [Candidatus Dojkabacteria bacterium]
MQDNIEVALEKLDSSLKKATNILVISHQGADIDAAASCLLFKELASIHYNNIQDIDIRLEGKPSTPISSIRDLKKILSNYIESFDEIFLDKYDTLVIVDASDLGRCFDNADFKMIEDNNILVIDHHQNDLLHRVDIHIDRALASATEEIYTGFRGILKRI